MTNVKKTLNLARATMAVRQDLQSEAVNLVEIFKRHDIDLTGGSEGI